MDMVYIMFTRGFLFLRMASCMFWVHGWLNQNNFFSEFALVGWLPGKVFVCETWPIVTMTESMHKYSMAVGENPGPVVKNQNA